MTREMLDAMERRDKALAALARLARDVRGGSVDDKMSDDEGADGVLSVEPLQVWTAVYCAAMTAIAQRTMLSDGGGWDARDIEVQSEIAAEYAEQGTLQYIGYVMGPEAKQKAREMRHALHCPDRQSAKEMWAGKTAAERAKERWKP